jgi:fatty-acyl-CoA synthase
VEDKITIGELVNRMASKYPDNEALVYPFRDLRHSYKEFSEIRNKVAKSLLKLGVQKGEHVAIWAANLPEWVYTQFGSGTIGAVLVTVSTSFKQMELEYQLKQSDATTLIMMEGTRNSDFRSIINELCPELKKCKPGKLVCKRLPDLKNVIMIGGNKYPGMFSWDEFMQLGEDVSDEELAMRVAEVDPDDTALMIYTSGTTGFPKGVMLTHYNIIANAIAQATLMNLKPEDRMCIAVPFFHSFGTTASNTCCVATGATMVPVEFFDPDAVLRTIEKERCTVLNGVPTMFKLELEQLEKGNYDVSSLRTGTIAGAACPADLVKKLVDVMHMSEVITSYGQTEASPCITSTRCDDPLEWKAMTSGRPIPGVEVKIVDPETGMEVPQGKQGEIYARGYNVMKGYYKMPEATTKTVDSEGWLHTGDAGFLDENGNLVITCRLKEMIIRGGENIYPREIEDFLRIHPLIKDVQVVGVPSEKYGEEVMAFIRVKEGHTLTAESVKNFCKGQITSFKIPKYIAFVDDYPYTASGKVQKFKLRDMGIEMLMQQEQGQKVT